MRKTLEELNAQYVPGNGSTNFTNNTCRKRLLNRYIGEGNWEYIYEGRKVVAVEIHVEEEVIEEDVEVEIELEEVNGLLFVRDPETESEYDTQIQQLSVLEAEYENKLKRVRDRIAYLEGMHHNIGSVKDVFKGINFRKYSWRKNIDDNYNEIQRRYSANRNRVGIEKEYNKVMNKFLVQAYKHAHSFYSWCEFCSLRRFRDFEKSTWNLWYGKIYSSTEEWWMDKKTCEDYKKYFTVDTRGLDNYIEGAEKLFNMFTGCGFENTEEYKYISEVVEMMKEYKRKATEYNSKSESLFKEFCDGYSSYVKDRLKQEEDMFNNWRKQFTGRRTSTGSTTSSKYFSGCTTARELKKKYREWAQKLHPDHGGNQDEFIAMKNEFDRLMKHTA